MDTEKIVTHQEEANNPESNKQKVSITDLQSKLLSFEAELKEYRDTLEDLQANICEAENQTNAAKKTEEAPELENILTLSDVTPGTITGSASVGNQEKDTITATTKETKAKGKRSWWQKWPTAPNHPPPTSEAESGAGTGKVLEGNPDDHHQLQDNDKNPDPGAARAQEQLANLTSKFTAIETSQQEIKTVQQKFAEKSAQGVTHIELEARLTKLQDFIKVNNFDKLQERIKENEARTDKDLKSIEEETDRLLQDLENRLGAKITNMEQMMKKQTTDLETKLESRITNSSTQMQAFAEKIEDQFDSLKMEKDTALVAADNKLAEQTDNANTLLEMNALNQNLVKDMASFNQKVVSLQKNMSKQAGLPNRVTSLEQKYHNLSSRLGRMQELTDKIIPLEQLVEEIRDGTNNDLPMCKICKARPCAMTFRCWQQKQP